MLPATRVDTETGLTANFATQRVAQSVSRTVSNQYHFSSRFDEAGIMLVQGVDVVDRPRDNRTSPQSRRYCLRLDIK